MVFMAANLKRPVWIASGSVTNGVTQFAAPVEYGLNVRTTSSVLDIMAFGVQHTEYRRAVAPNAMVVNIKPLDRAWLDTTPINPDVLGKTADYYVVSVTQGRGGVAEILFRRLLSDA